MIKYNLELYRTEYLPSENDFWALHRKYHAAGFSDSSKDHELLGKFHSLSFETEEPITLDQIQEEFSNVTITGLEPLVKNKSLIC